MGVKIKKVHVAIDSNGCRVRPNRLHITYEKILKYIENNPMPEDPIYSPNDLIIDLTDPPSFWMLPINIKEETIRYIEKLVDELRNDRR